MPEEAEDSQMMRTVPLAEIEMDVATLSEKEFVRKYDFSKDDLRVFLETLVRNLTMGPSWACLEAQK